MIGKLVALPVRSGAANEVVSGMFQNSPMIYGRMVDEGCGKDVAYLVIHPTSNFMNHYLLGPMQQRGRAILALNTRFVTNESNLIVERTLQDLGAGVRFLREEGYKRICLIGNSGGGALVSLYQAEAEKLTISTTPDGRPVDLQQSDLPAADSIAIVAAHLGRAQTLTVRMDAAVIEEGDLTSCDPSLDIFNAANGPPFSTDFVARVRSAQIARNRRITEWCQARLREFDSMKGKSPIVDRPFIINRTYADPRYVDLTIDPSDRGLGSKGHTAIEANYAANNMGRVSTLRSWLSQWSYDLSRAKGPESLARTSVPVLLAYYTADPTIYPSDYETWGRASVGRSERVDFKGVGHYPTKHPDQLNKLATLLADWAVRH